MSAAAPEAAPDAPAVRPLLDVAGLRKHFHIRGGLANRIRGTVHAVDDISFSIAPGEILGVVGESGCGKSTVARLLMHLIRPDQGRLAFDGRPVGAGGLSVPELRRRMQLVFQDSYASLNPRLTVLDSIVFAPRMHGTPRPAAERQGRRLLDLVSLSPRLFANRYPHELSGGQRQRVNIARALALEPRLVLLDEAVSALDKSVEAQILSLLLSLRQELGLTYLFISHDLNVIEFISDRILVMYLGRVVESGPVEAIWRDPRHPYTRALLASKPSLDPRRRTLKPPISGDPPNPIDPPSGCRFRTRCGFAEAVCAAAPPPLKPLDGTPDHRAACLIHQTGSGHSLAAAP